MKLFFCVAILSLYLTSITAVYAKDFLCILKDVKVDNVSNGNKSALLYVSNLNVDTDGNGKTNFYENIKYNNPNLPFDLVQIFNTPYYFIFNEKETVLTDMKFNSINNHLYEYSTPNNKEKVFLDIIELKNSDLDLNIKHNSNTIFSTIKLGCSVTLKKPTLSSNFLKPLLFYIPS